MRFLIVLSIFERLQSGNDICDLNDPQPGINDRFCSLDAGRAGRVWIYNDLSQRFNRFSHARPDRSSGLFHKL